LIFGLIWRDQLRVGCGEDFKRQFGESMHQRCAPLAGKNQPWMCGVASRVVVVSFGACCVLHSNDARAFGDIAAGVIAAWSKHHKRPLGESIAR
jgi:hypothetical protein